MSEVHTEMTWLERRACRRKPTMREDKKRENIFRTVWQVWDKDEMRPR